MVKTGVQLDEPSILSLEIIFHEYRHTYFNKVEDSNFSCFQLAMPLNS